MVRSSLLMLCFLCATNYCGVPKKRTVFLRDEPFKHSYLKETRTHKEQRTAQYKKNQQQSHTSQYKLLAAGIILMSTSMINTMYDLINETRTIEENWILNSSLFCLGSACIYQSRNTNNNHKKQNYKKRIT